MKSLVEEASSVMKAIEKAWDRAGKPETFSVKVFETPEKSFFGFTKKSAKVGIFFNEEPPQQTGKRQSPQTSAPREQQRRTADGAQQRPAHKDRDRRQGQQRPQFQNRQRDEQREEVAPLAEQQVHNGLEQKNERPERQQRTDRRTQGPRQERFDRPERTDRRTPHNDRREVAPQESHAQQEEVQIQHYQPQERMQREPRDRDRDHRGSRNDRDSRNNRGNNSRDGGGRDRRGPRRDDNRGPRREHSEQYAADERYQQQAFHETVQSSEAQNEGAPVEHSVMPTPAPVMPQKKVLKVSGRRYTAPVKTDDTDNNTPSDK